MNIDSVDAAEKEASEVLHSLLSVERIEKPVQQLHGPMQQVVFIDCKNDGNQPRSVVDRQQWNNLPQTVFNSLGNSENYQNNDWEGTLKLDVDQPLTQDLTLQLLESSRNCDTLKNDTRNCDTLKNDKLSNDSHQIGTDQKPLKTAKKNIRKRYKKDITIEKDKQHYESTFEDSADEVRIRFQLGCECQDDCCFKGLNPENVYKHRLNIAELTKEEHDMYLMGVTMACMADPGVTAKQRKRRRLRAQYVYQGRRVCLSAFLYLENCTLYQLKRIRKHVMTHGVAPRVHGNHGKKPHNVFPLDTYRRATEFLKSYVEKYNIGSSNSKSPILFPPEISRKTIHNLYTQMMMETGPAGQKLMGYSTFRHFMKEQFPQVRFCKQEPGSLNSSVLSNSSTKHVNSINNNNNSSNNNTNNSSNVNNNTSVNQQNQQHQLAQPQQPSPHAPVQNSHQHQHDQPQQIITTCIGNSHNPNATDIDEVQTINVSVQTVVSSSVTPNTLTQTTCPVSVSGSPILSSTQMASIPFILSGPCKPDMAQQETAFIVTPMARVVQPFPAGHAITVTPITNSGYAFATL